MLIVLILFVCIFLLLVYRRSLVPVFSPGLTVIYGKKGSGKSVYLAKVASQKKLTGTVYSNVPLNSAYSLPEDFYSYSYPRGSTLLIDEGGIVFNSRNFKQFPKQAIIWFKLQRHLGVRVFMTSQAPDVDLIIRNLADNIFIARRLGPVTYLSEYIRSIVVTRAKDGKGSDITDDYHPRGIFGILITLNFRYFKMFDSYSVPSWLKEISKKSWSETNNDVYHL